MCYKNIENSNLKYFLIYYIKANVQGSPLTKAYNKFLFFTGGLVVCTKRRSCSGAIDSISMNQ